MKIFKNYKKVVGAGAAGLMATMLMATPAFASVGSGSVGGGGGAIGDAFAYIVTWVGGNSTTDDDAIGALTAESVRITGKRAAYEPSTVTVRHAVDAACTSARSNAGLTKSNSKTVAAMVAVNSIPGNANHATWNPEKARFSDMVPSVNSRIDTEYSRSYYKPGLAAKIRTSLASRISSHPTNSMKAVCVVMSNTDLEKAFVPYDFNVDYNKTDTKLYDHLYSYNLSLNKQIMAAGSSSKWVDQTVVDKTNYGEALDELAKKYKDVNMTEAQFAEAKTILDAAIAQDAATPNTKDLTIDMTDVNKQAFAQGGVVNVTKNQQNRIANVTDNRNGRVSFSGCTAGSKAEATKAAAEAFKSPTMTIAQINAAIIKLRTDYGCASKNTGVVTLTITSPIPTTAIPVAFWQMISVHCNEEGFTALKNSVDGATVINTGDPSQRISAVMHSKEYAQAPAMLDFGHPGTPSGSVGFYDKECPFECIANPDTTVANANSANLNVTNTVDGSKGTSEKAGLTGAKSDKINGNTLTFFRDNDPKIIDVDLWYPTPGSNGVVNYAGEPAQTTTVTRWIEGTPGVNGETGGKFRMNAIDGSTKKTLFTGTGNPKTQKNWNKSTDSTRTSEILAGQFTKFDVAATWASEEDKPQVLNFKWEYAPNVDTRFPTTSIGFSGDNSKILGNVNTVSEKIEGKCYANFGTDTSIDTVDLFQKYTGTNTTNNLDKGPIQGTTKDLQTNLVIDFVRATTE